MRQFLLMVTVAVCAWGQPPKEAAWAKKLAWGDPDLSGVWQQDFRDRNNRKVIGLDLADFVEIPYQAWSKTAYEFNKTNKGQARDPEAACLPAGVPRSTGLPYPLRFMQSQDLIAILHEGNVHSYRLIFMNQPMPKDPNPSWMGHSVGHWDGNTLVIETAGFNEKTWLDPGGHVHSDKMRTTERFTRLGEKELRYEFTIDDPDAYTKPWSWSYVLQGHPDWEIIEYVCNENNKDLEHMVEGTK